MQFMLRLSPDITIKSDRTRRRFMRLVVDNLRDAFESSGVRAQVEPGWARLFVHSDDLRVEEIAPRVFGVHSLSRVETIEAGSLERLVSLATPYFQPQMTNHTFAVRARCTGTTALRSNEIEVELGARLVQHGKVQLVEPEVTCHVEVRDGTAYLFSESIAGWRGLPINSEGRAIALISGGFDSAVAAWLMMRRGVALDYVFCRLGGPVHTQGTLRVLQVLAERWSYGSRPQVFLVPFEGLIEEIRAHCRPAMWQLILKRFMYRAAYRKARQTHASAIVTGESLGQVSSQTLKNLVALDQRMELPVLRPLLTLDKEEIIGKSREIGTYDLSATVMEYCAIATKKPAVAARLEDVAAEEAKVQLDLAQLDPEVKTLQARRMTAEDLSLGDLETEQIPTGAVVIDLRGRNSYELWHYPEALHLDLSQAMKMVPAIEKSKTYVIYCEFGLKSAHLAMLMREHGIQAYNFHGGMRALLRYAADRDLIPADFLSNPALL